MFERAERRYLARARVARLATTDADGRPHVVPICFALHEGEIVTPIDEKPKQAAPTELRRVRDIREHDRVALVADHYVEEWNDLGWVQVRGRARISEPTNDDHRPAVSALREKYDQYDSHSLDDRPVIVVSPGSVRSWGLLDPALG
ncbi:MAG: TIGR03668 family PPOX class F420-dependent oxidoreductase [Salinirussus sp.]